MSEEPKPRAKSRVHSGFSWSCWQSSPQVLIAVRLCLHSWLRSESWISLCLSSAISALADTVLHSFVYCKCRLICCCWRSGGLSIVIMHGICLQWEVPYTSYVCVESSYRVSFYSTSINLENFFEHIWPVLAIEIHLVVPAVVFCTWRESSPHDVQMLRCGLIDPYDDLSL